jgi:uroporphyrin-III C-methyltransferase
MAGTVYLVGAGPGDPELITVRGLRRLRRAEVLVYDRLVHPDLVEEAPAGAERLYVGKAPGNHRHPQEAINALLVARALAGHTVVRLKGGDPFIFGRGSEEAMACAAAGVPCEIIPGLSSATAVPAWAGIPLTHRALAASFGVFTAHRAADLDDLDWPTMARLDTLVLLMGVARLPYIRNNLIRCGRPAHTPAAIVQQGTYADGRTVTATLAALPEVAKAEGVRSPAVIVVGAVVGLREGVSGVGLETMLEAAPLPPRVVEGWS